MNDDRPAYCPFCASSRVGIVEVMSLDCGPVFRGACEGCGTVGPVGGTRELALFRWDRRMKPLRTEPRNVPRRWWQFWR